MATFREVGFARVRLSGRANSRKGGLFERALSRWATLREAFRGRGFPGGRLSGRTNLQVSDFPRTTFREGWFLGGRLSIARFTGGALSGRAAFREGAFREGDLAGGRLPGRAAFREGDFPGRRLYGRTTLQEGKSRSRKSRKAREPQSALNRRDREIDATWKFPKSAKISIVRESFSAFRISKISEIRENFETPRKLRNPTKTSKSRDNFVSLRKPGIGLFGRETFRAGEFP